MNHELDHTTVSEDGVSTLYCKCGYSTINESMFRDHRKLANNSEYGRGVQYEPSRDEYVLNADEVKIIKQGLELFIGLFTQTRPGDARDAARLLKEL